MVTVVGVGTGFAIDGSVSEDVVVMRGTFPGCCASTALGAVRRPPVSVPRNARRA
jgi:hypothetical protein